MYTPKKRQFLAKKFNAHTYISDEHNLVTLISTTILDCIIWQSKRKQLNIAKQTIKFPFYTKKEINLHMCVYVHAYIHMFFTYIHSYQHLFYT